MASRLYMHLPLIFKTAKDNVTNEYLEALNKFWTNNLEDAIDYVSRFIAENPAHPNLFCFYRLWIELLITLNDEKSLRSIQTHLLRRSKQEEENAAIYRSLRGLIHLELDEMEAALLIQKGLDQDHNPYTEELRQRISHRFSANTKENPWLALPLSEICDQLVDYFHWQTLVQGLIVYSENERDMNTVLSCITEVFPASPLPGSVALQKFLEDKYYEGAILEVNRLLKLYPDNVEFHLYGAIAKILSNDIYGAKEILTRALHLTGENDPDILSLLGHCYSKMALTGQNRLVYEKAIFYLKKAVTVLKSMGLPSAVPGTNLQILIDAIPENRTEEKPNIEDITPARFWLLKLSAGKYHDIQTKSKQEIEYLLRPMGNAPKPGDLCFFAADEPYGKKSTENPWRVIAIYAVVSEPMWDPIHRYVSALRLESRLPESIPVDVCLLDADSAGTLPKIDKNHPFRYGVFELEEGALSIITEAIRQRNIQPPESGVLEKTS